MRKQITDKDNSLPLKYNK